MSLLFRREQPHAVSRIDVPVESLSPLHPIRPDGRVPADAAEARRRVSA